MSDGTGVMVANLGGGGEGGEGEGGKEGEEDEELNCTECKYQPNYPSNTIDSEKHMKWNV